MVFELTSLSDPVLLIIDDYYTVASEEVQTIIIRGRETNGTYECR